MMIEAALLDSMVLVFAGTETESPTKANLFCDSSVEVRITASVRKFFLPCVNCWVVMWYVVFFLDLYLDRQQRLEVLPLGKVFWIALLTVQLDSLLHVASKTKHDQL